MKRDELWRHLIDADVNVEYFAGVSTCCRWVDFTVRVTLVMGCAGSLMALSAKPEWQTTLAWISFVAAVIEVVIKPVTNWNSVGLKARAWRCDWIDLRSEFEKLWRENFASKATGIVVADLLIDKVNELEKSDGYFPRIQWIVDRLGKAAERRRGASRS